MKLPLSLIKQFVAIDHSIEEIADALTKSGIEVDAIENPTPSFTNVVLGKIVSKDKHPDADKLTVLKVFDGTEELDIVCGAPNCKEGMHVALAKIGASLTDQEGKSWKIKKSKIRGAVSCGMLCSKKELGIGSDHDGIIEIPEQLLESVKIGQDLTNTLWDPVFELSLTPNLGHCFSALGVARELSCFLNVPLKEIDTTFSSDPDLKTANKISAFITSENCTKYNLCFAENIHVGPSPFWLQLLLERASLRSINNIVDITNLVMLELGQPLHAFDYDLLEGAITLCDQENKETFEGLDGIERQIPEGSCVIKDKKKVVAIGGIIGANNSAVSDKTKSLLLEAGFFDSTSIRKSARKLGLRTDSAQRFERKTDPEGLKKALERVCYYLNTLCNATIASDQIAISKKEIPVKTISLRTERASRLLGLHLSQSEIEEIFERLGLSFSSKEGEIEVTPPTYRHDLNIEEDLLEEIARVFGYDHLKGKKPKYTTTKIPHDPMYLFENKLRQLLIGQGLSEWLTCDLISPKLKNLISDHNISDSSIIEVMHAKSIDYSIMRPSLMPGLLECVKKNISFKNKDIQAFEIGKVHLKEERKFIEPTLFSILLTGKKPLSWDKNEETYDFFDLKGILENIFLSLGLKATYTPSDHDSFHPFRQAHIHIDGIYIGVIGQIAEDLCRKIDIKEKIFFAELQCDLLLEKEKKQKQFTELLTQPASERDLTLTLDKKVLVSDILEKLNKVKPLLLEKMFLVDLFEDEKIGHDKKNITIRFTYRDPIRTLSFDEVEKAHNELISSISF